MVLSRASRSNLKAFGGKHPRLLSVATENPDRWKIRAGSVPVLGPWTDLLERPAQFVAEIDVEGRSAIVVGSALCGMDNATPVVKHPA